MDEKELTDLVVQQLCGWKSEKSEFSVPEIVNFLGVTCVKHHQIVS